MPRAHLAAAKVKYGLPAGTEDVLRVLESGISKLKIAERARRTQERGTDKKLNPSISDAGKCSRAVVYSLMNVEESDPPELDSEMRFIFGHAAEDAIAKILEAHQGATVQREERIEIVAGSRKVTGRSDFGSVLVAVDKETWELKLTNSDAVWFMLSRNSPNEAHVHQLNLYLHARGEQKGRLVYLVAGAKKGEPCAAAWTIEHDDEMARNDLQSLINAAELAEHGILPPIPEGYKQNAFPCGYCNYRTKCWLAASITQGLAAYIVGADAEATTGRCEGNPSYLKEK